MAFNEPETPPVGTDPTPDDEASSAIEARGNDAPRSAERQVPGRAPGDARDDGPAEAYEALARSARLAEFVAITELVLSDVLARRQPDFAFDAKVAEAAQEANLSRADAETPFGNVLKVLSSGPEDRAERALASALFAHVLAESGRKDEDRAAHDLLWLATHTGFDATLLIDRALGEDAEFLLKAIVERIERVIAGRGASLGRGEAIVGVGALVNSSSQAARQLANGLLGKAEDPLVRRLLRSHAELAGGAPLSGCAVRAPRGPFLTTLLGVTGLLFVMHLVGLVGRWVLNYRRPAEITVAPSGISVRTSVRLLHRTLREREEIISAGQLARVVREVRYPRVAFYAGLLALAVGSLVGVRTFVDGVAGASPSLLGAGLAIVALGVAADFVLGSLLPSSQGRCRVCIVDKSGRTLCIGDVDADEADALLRKVRATLP